MKNLSPLKTTALILGALATVGSVGLLAAPGTLEPPAGPISGTGHTVAEIYDKLVELQASVGAATVGSGPWQARYFVGQNPPAIALTNGPTLVHSIVVYNMQITLQDGESGPVITSVRSAQVGTGGFQAQDVQVLLDVLVQNGAYITFQNAGGGGPPHGTVLYRTLTP